MLEFIQLPETVAPKDVYTREEVLRLLRISERQLQGWERHDLIRPARTFAFSDLIALKTLVKLRASHVPVSKIRLAMDAIRGKVNVSDPLKELKVYSDGRRIRVEVAGQQMEPFSGQLLLNFGQQELRRLLSFPGKSDKADERARKESAEKLFQRGLELEHSGAIEMAIEAYQNATQLDPRSAGAFVNLGTIYFNAKDWKKAEHYYNHALEVDPEYPLAHFNIANLYDELGDDALATKHYATAVRLNPRYADAHYNLALLYQGSGKIMEAVRHWQVYLKLDPASAWGAIARRELGKLKKSAVVDGKNGNMGEDRRKG